MSLWGNGTYPVELSNLSDMTGHMARIVCDTQHRHFVKSFGGDLTRSTPKLIYLGKCSKAFQSRVQIRKLLWKAACSVLSTVFECWGALILGRSADGGEIWVLALGAAYFIY